MELFDIIELLQMGTNFITGIISVAVYVLQALALYTIAQRRGISKPWLAWIPFGNVWILGSISDQYRYVTRREVKNMRKVLLWVNIAAAVMAVVFIVVLFSAAASALLSSFDSLTGILPGSNVSDMEELGRALADKFFWLLGSAIAMLGFSIASMILSWIAIYDLFLSCEPANAMVYLLISIIGGFMTGGVQVIFLMICRNKDLGMPPRREESVQPVVEYQPEETWVQE